MLLWTGNPDGGMDTPARVSGYWVAIAMAAAIMLASWFGAPAYPR